MGVPKKRTLLSPKSSVGGFRPGAGRVSGATDGVAKLPHQNHTDNCFSTGTGCALKSRVVRKPDYSGRVSIIKRSR
jgi:hypothetical protein